MNILYPGSESVKAQSNLAILIVVSVSSSEPKIDRCIGMPIYISCYGNVADFHQQHLLIQAATLLICVEQGWAISSPRTTSGPPQRFQWLVKAFRKNLQIWNLLLITVKVRSVRLTWIETLFYSWKDAIKQNMASLVMKCHRKSEGIMVERVSEEPTETTGHICKIVSTSKHCCRGKF